MMFDWFRSWSSFKGNVQLPVTPEELATQQAGGLSGVPNISLNIGESSNSSSSIFAVAAVIDLSLWPPSTNTSMGNKPPSPTAGQLLSSIVAVAVKSSACTNCNLSFVDISFVGAVKVFNATPPINFTITCPPRYVVTKSHTCNDKGYVETVQC
ncbi:hypothetical protein EON65_17620 [archaeon]|nr:MAG: hypothetical protein EON65_17620 [archaeon]